MCTDTPHPPAACNNINRRPTRRWSKRSDRIALLDIHEDTPIALAALSFSVSVSNTVRLRPPHGPRPSLSIASIPISSLLVLRPEDHIPNKDQRPQARPPLYTPIKKTPPSHRKKHRSLGCRSECPGTLVVVMCATSYWTKAGAQAQQLASLS